MHFDLFHSARNKKKSPHLTNSTDFIQSSKYCLHALLYATYRYLSQVDIFLYYIRTYLYHLLCVNVFHIMNFIHLGAHNKYRLLDAIFTTF